MAVPIPNPPAGPDQFNPGGGVTPVPDAATQISNADQASAPAPEAPAPSGAALPTDIQPSPAATTPPAPPKIGFREAISRGMREQGSPQYTATGTGEIETAEPARTFGKGGILGMILGGAL